MPVRLETDGVVVEQEGTEKKLPVDSLVYAGRMVSHNELSESLKNETNVFSIGDCVKPDRIMDAVWGAFETVREIEST